MAIDTSSRPWAIITGASEGIGEGFAIHLDRRATHNLILVARTKPKLEKVASEIKIVETKIIVADLSAPGAAEKLFEDTKPIAVFLLINNAGMTPGGIHEEIDFPTIQKTTALNVTVLTELTTIFLPRLRDEREKLRSKQKQTKYGLSGIINLSSLSAFMPIPSMALYAATKTYILSFTESVCQEHRNRGLDFPIVCSLPGAVKSSIWEKEGASSATVRMPMDTVDHVVAATLGALDANKSLIIPGYMNNFFAFTTRLGPRWMNRTISRFMMGQDPALRDPKEVEETMRKLREAKKIAA